MKFIIYLFIFYIVYQVIKIFRRLSQSRNNDKAREEKLQSKYRNIEEADYKELGSEPRNKTDKE